MTNDAPIIALTFLTSKLLKLLLIIVWGILGSMWSRWWITSDVNPKYSVGGDVGFCSLFSPLDELLVCRYCIGLVLMIVASSIVVPDGCTSSWINLGTLSFILVGTLSAVVLIRNGRLKALIWHIKSKLFSLIKSREYNPVAILYGEFFLFHFFLVRLL